MSNKTKIFIVVALLTAIVVVVAIKHNKSALSSDASKSSITDISAITEPASAVEKSNKPLPRLVDLGAKKCIPCKMMAPILEELKTEYADVFKVEFIDVWENPDSGKEYGISLIPTQIFFDASGKELFRHEGFFSKEDILAKWKEFGLSLNKEEK
ncbi:MAG: thioredoxin family protein [Planctomycetota bacterium]|jgi:thioredoxin 1